ncbi:MAG: response regulator [Eisenbergiella sp.]
MDEVFTAYTAMDAREIVSGNKIDIIVCDIEMPQENGLFFWHG